MIEVYMSRKGPQPLGTVVSDEIEARAKEKLKEYPGESLGLRKSSALESDMLTHPPIR